MTPAAHSASEHDDPCGNFRTWMVGLSSKARDWVQTRYARDPHVGRLAATESYIDLIFAWALAQLGESKASVVLQQRATAALTGSTARATWRSP